MINDKETLKHFGYLGSKLSNGSHKKIISECEQCRKFKISRRDSYRKLCRSCAKKNMSIETKQKISQSKTGIKPSAETKLKMSIAHSGKNNVNYGHVMTQKQKDMISKTKTGNSPAPNKGMPMSDEQKNKLTGMKKTNETKQKISNNKKEFLKNGGKNNLGKYLEKGHISLFKGTFRTDEQKAKIPKRVITKEWRIKISCAHQNIGIENWNGFVKENPYCDKFNEKCRDQNRNKYNNKCFICDKIENDNITCKGDVKKLSVHHIDRNKNQGCNNKKWNLIPLCMSCHGMVHNDLWENRILYLMNENDKKEK